MTQCYKTHHDELDTTSGLMVNKSNFLRSYMLLVIVWGISFFSYGICTSTLIYGERTLIDCAIEHEYTRKVFFYDYGYKIYKWLGSSILKNVNKLCPMEYGKQFRIYKNIIHI